MKICYSPYNKNAMEQNKYIFQVTEAMKKSGYEIISFNELIKNLNYIKDTKIFNFNWYENIYNKNKFLSIYTYYKRIIIIYILKILRKKIVWTIHNKLPHDSNNEKLCKKFMYKLYNLSDLIIIHCNDTINELNFIQKNKEINKKIIKINHPNYIGLYNNKLNLKKIYNIKENDIVFLFIGQIKPYKNIEIIIEVAKRIKYDNVKFIIAGKCNDELYKKNLLVNIEDKSNIIPIFRFIKNEEIGDIVSMADSIFLPYDTKSSLNSGTVILACSLGKTVLCPDIGTIKQINSYENLYSYNYENECDHINKVVKIISDIVESNNAKNILKEKGMNLFKIMNEQYNLDKISREYDNAYKNIFNKV